MAFIFRIRFPIKSWLRNNQTFCRRSSIRIAVTKETISKAQLSSNRRRHQKIQRRESKSHNQYWRIKVWGMILAEKQKNYKVLYFRLCGKHLNPGFSQDLENCTKLKPMKRSLVWWISTVWMTMSSTLTEILDHSTVYWTITGMIWFYRNNFTRISFNRNKRMKFTNVTISRSV